MILIHVNDRNFSDLMKIMQTEYSPIFESKIFVRNFSKIFLRQKWLNFFFFEHVLE